ncbi:tRNA (uracil-O(2)-)-methyltransferase [Trinorchestia longiramus]|nr:tRNA (uracil-O(2)-)-methyltransferase [Trinorchestia longiramus]
MDYQLGDHICRDASFSSPGSKSQKHSHEDDSTKMSKKLKEDISDKTAYFNCRQEVNVLSQNCAQNLEDCSNLLEESTVRNDSKSHELSGSSNGDSLPKMEAELDDAPQTTHFITGKNSPQSYIQSQEIGLLQPNHLKSASNQSVSLCTPDNFEASSKKNSEAQNLQPNRKGFWEALKVHIERPHILNRRLCGVVDIWWGCTSCCSRPEQPGSTSASVGSMQNLLCNGQEVESSDQMKVSLGDALFDIARSTWSVLNSNRDSDLPLGTEISISNTLLRSDLKLTALERKVITDLQERGFKVFDGKEPLVETCTALGSGNESCYVVVRRVLPKLQERYASVTEVIIMDGRSKNCCFLSEVTVPPLLPARPYVINCRDCPLTATDSSIECSTAGSAVQSAALPHSDVTAANNAGDDGTATPDAVCGGNDGTATPGAGCGGDGTVGTAASSDVAADAASETVNDSSCECQKSSFQQLSMNPSGFFQCSFIAGICENTTGDASKGDGRVWLEGTVLPRLQKWALPRKSQEPRTRSLQLIDLQAYGVMYHKLKSKYAAHFIQSWSERTDPKKFVHEDIGIATYLLLLWSELSRPQRFVDLGCGNGLLVYILTKEGHVGAGYDIKRRNIWHERFSDIDLQVGQSFLLDVSVPCARLHRKFAHVGVPRRLNPARGIE